jgi:adenosylcobinamide-GDP ribazoletransferase
MTRDVIRITAVAAGAVVVGEIVLRAVKRFGGVTGDVFGAAVEAALATILIALSAG